MIASTNRRENIMKILKVTFALCARYVAVDHEDVRPSHHIESDIMFATWDMFDDDRKFVGNQSDILPIVENIVSTHLSSEYKVQLEFK